MSNLTYNLTLIGATERETTLLRSLLNFDICHVNAIWEYKPQLPVDLLIVNPDSEQGAKLMQSGLSDKQVVAIFAADAQHEKQYLWLPSPLRIGGLTELLRNAASQLKYVLDDVPEKKEGIKSSSQSTTDSDVAVTDGDSLVSTIYNIMRTSTTGHAYQIVHPTFKPLYIVPAHKTYYLDAPVTMLKEAATLSDFKVHTLPLPENITTCLQIEPKAISILCWYAGMYGSNGKLLPWLDPEATFRLKRWPNFNNMAYQLNAMQLNTATQLIKQPLSISELCKGSRLPEAIVCDLINACAMCDFLVVESTRHEHQAIPSSPKKSGLIARIRERLGL